MTGFVNSNLEAVIELMVSRDYGRHAGGSYLLSAVIDTGFSDYLALPTDIIDDLDLRAFGEKPVTLGDGSARLLNVYTGYVFWNEDWRPIEVIATDGEALIGMSLLSNSRITLDVRDGGAVSIISLF